MSDYNVDYAQRRRTVDLIIGKDEKGKIHFVRNAPVIFNVNADRLTSITLLEATGGKKVARFNREDVLVKDGGQGSNLIIDNLMSGRRLSHLEGVFR